MLLREDPEISTLETTFDLTDNEKVPVRKMSKILFTIVDSNGPSRKMVKLD